MQGWERFPSPAAVWHAEGSWIVTGNPSVQSCDLTLGLCNGCAVETKSYNSQEINLLQTSLSGDSNWSFDALTAQKMRNSKWSDNAWPGMPFHWHKKWLLGTLISATSKRFCNVLNIYTIQGFVFEKCNCICAPKYPWRYCIQNTAFLQLVKSDGPYWGIIPYNHFIYMYIPNTYCKNGEECQASGLDINSKCQADGEALHKQQIYSIYFFQSFSWIYALHSEADKILMNLAKTWFLIGFMSSYWWGMPNIQT